MWRLELVDVGRGCLRPQPPKLHFDDISPTHSCRPQNQPCKLLAIPQSTQRTNRTNAIRKFETNCNFSASALTNTMATSPNGTLHPNPGPQDDDEWEWEYDHDNIEHFYFTLDLTTHDPSAADAPDRIVPNKPPNASDRPSSAGRSNPSTPAATPAPPQTPVDQPTEHGISLQILDLHSDNPLVKLGHDLFSCEWMSELGTQFYLAREGFVSDAIRSGHVIDIVGASNARLTGKPIKLRVNQKWREAAMRGDHDAAPIIIDDDDPDNSNAQLNSSEVLSVPRDLITDNVTRQQASFLEKLSAVKARKKRSSLVWMKEAKHYTPPFGISEIRRKAQSQVQPETGGVKKASKAKANPASSKRGKSFQLKTNSNFVPGIAGPQGVPATPLASSPARTTGGTHEQSPSVAGAEETSMPGSKSPKRFPGLPGSSRDRGSWHERHKERVIRGDSLTEAHRRPRRRSNS